MPPQRTPSTTTLPTLTGVRLVALAIALAGIAVAVRTTITSTTWIGSVLPGFMILDNRVVASVGLAHWTRGANGDQ